MYEGNLYGTHTLHDHDYKHSFGLRKESDRDVQEEEEKPCVWENKGSQMTRYETRLLDWPSHFIITASIPEATENSKLSICTIHMLHSDLASGNILPSSLNIQPEKYRNFFFPKLFHEKT